MKPKTIVAVFLYLIIFGFGSWWLYNRYFHNVVTSPDNSQTAINPDKSIFYSKDNNLYQLNADVLNASSKDINNLRFQSTGQVNTIVIASEPKILFYEVTTPLKIKEIWQVSLKDNNAEKLFSVQTPGLEKYSNFRNPKLSAKQDYLAFIASKDGLDQIFSYKISDKSLTNLIYPNYTGQISDYTWSPIKDELYFVTYTNGKSVVKTLDLNKTIANLWENPAVITKITLTTDKIIFQYIATNAANLGYIPIATLGEIIPITDLTTPKTIARYDINKTGTTIVYQVNDATAKTNDIYIVNTDATNLLQISNDGKSYYPVFSPDGKKITFWLETQGIFTILTDKQSRQKILNEPSIINNIIIWS